MKIKYLAGTPHCFAYGGFEVQLLAAFDSLKDIGVEVSKLDPWSKHKEFDVLHAWGLKLSNIESIEWAKKSGKKVVLTVLLPYYETIESKIRHFVSLNITKISKLYKSALDLADCIVVVNELQKEVICNIYNIVPSKVEVIPNIVDPIFSRNEIPESESKVYDSICVGNICKRKNQLFLSEVFLDTNFSLALVGNPLEGEEDYFKDVMRICNNSNGRIQYLGNFKENSVELLNVYKKSRYYILLSYLEMQPISALEALSVGLPLILSNKRYSQDSLFGNPYRVPINDKKKTRSAISNILIQQGFEKVDSYRILEECSPRTIALKYRNIYQSFIR